MMLLILTLGILHTSGSAKLGDAENLMEKQPDGAHKRSADVLVTELRN